MSANETSPAYEEFKSAIERELIPLIKVPRETYGGPSAREYIESDECSRITKERYAIDLENFNSGLITKRAFLGDAAYSVALCLSLMYDGEQG